MEIDKIVEAFRAKINEYKALEQSMSKYSSGVIKSIEIMEMLKKEENNELGYRELKSFMVGVEKELGERVRQAGHGGAVYFVNKFSESCEKYGRDSYKHYCDLLDNGDDKVFINAMPDSWLKDEGISEGLESLETKRGLLNKNSKDVGMVNSIKVSKDVLKALIIKKIRNDVTGIGSRLVPSEKKLYKELSVLRGAVSEVLKRKGKIGLEEGLKEIKAIIQGVKKELEECKGFLFNMLYLLKNIFTLGNYGDKFKHKVEQASMGKIVDDLIDEVSGKNKLDDVKNGKNRFSFFDESHPLPKVKNKDEVIVDDNLEKRDGVLFKE